MSSSLISRSIESSRQKAKAKGQRVKGEACCLLPFDFCHLPFDFRLWPLPFLSMSRLSAFGLFAVSAMLACYALEKRSHWFILAFAGACALGSAYGFLQGAWPFGLVEAVWSLVAVRRWWHARQQT